MTALSKEDLLSPKHRIEVLKGTRQHIDDKIFALEAEIAHREGYIGIAESEAFLASIRDQKT